MASKETLRLHFKHLREVIPANHRQAWNEAIAKTLFSTPAYQRANNLFVYISYGSEVNTTTIMAQAWADEKEVWVPRTTAQKGFMEAVRISGMEQLAPGKFGIPEPKDHLPASDFEVVELAIVPGIAFDRNGHRIGYGGGYYDRVLAQLNPLTPKLGLAYSVQVSEDPLPTESFDQPVDELITEQGWLSTGG